GGDYPPQTAILRLSSSEQTYMLHGPRFQTPRNDTGSTGRTYQDLHDRRRLYEQVFTAMQLITADVLRESMAMNRLSIEASDRAIEQPPAVCGGLPSYLTVYKDLLEQTSGHHVRLQTNLDEAKRAVETSYETARQIVNSAGGNIPQGVGPAEFYAKLDMYYDLGDEDTKKRIFLAEQNLMEARFRESQVEKHLIQSRLDRDEFAERIGRINDLRRDIESIGLGDKHDGLESGVEK
ncbi:MAG TPA: hypothetical protein VFG71_04855, partial [Nitrospiraceae bacterium]|nr:hypothetical protein [Nitrospiraceae bacterium]